MADIHFHLCDKDTPPTVDGEGRLTIEHPATAGEFIHVPAAILVPLITDAVTRGALPPFPGPIVETPSAGPDRGRMAAIHGAVNAIERANRISGFGIEAIEMKRSTFNEWLWLVFQVEAAPPDKRATAVYGSIEVRSGNDWIPEAPTFDAIQGHRDPSAPGEVRWEAAPVVEAIDGARRSVAEMDGIARAHGSPPVMVAVVNASRAVLLDRATVALRDAVRAGASDADVRILAHALADAVDGGR